MACKHKRLQKTVQVAAELSTDKKLVIDIWCAVCGASGSYTIEPCDVLWPEDEEDEERGRSR